jgi:hypothetical protein
MELSFKLLAIAWWAVMSLLIIRNYLVEKKRRERLFEDMRILEKRKSPATLRNER